MATLRNKYSQGQRTALLQSPARSRMGQPTVLTPANPALPATQHHSSPRASVLPRPPALPLALGVPSNVAIRRKTVPQRYHTAHPQNAAGLTLGQPRVLMKAAPALPHSQCRGCLRALWLPTVQHQGHNVRTGLHGSSTDPRRTTAPSLGQSA